MDLSKIEWICEDCYFNMGQYCDNDLYAHNYENCQNCEGYEEDEENGDESDDPYDIWGMDKPEQGEDDPLEGWGNE